MKYTTFYSGEISPIHVSKCDSLHHSYILSLRQICSTSACRRTERDISRTSIFDWSFRTVSRTMSSSRLRRLYLLRFVCRFLNGRHTNICRSMKRQSERSGLRCGHRRMYLAVISGHRNIESNCSIELRQGNGKPSALLLL
jgi:hypothetical protein